MSAVAVIASNTVRQVLRQKLFLNIAVFGLGMIAMAVVVGNVTYGFTDRVVRSIGLTGVTLALDLMALLVGVSLVYDEIDRKTLFAVLTRPVRRWEYVVGRYLGLVASLALALAGFTAVFFAALLIAYGTPSTQDVLALIGAYAEAWLLGAVGLLLSCFTTPMLGAGIGLGIWIAGSTVDDLVRLTKDAPDGLKLLAKAAYYALPALERLNFREAAVHLDQVGLAHFAIALTYGAAYSAIVILLAVIVLDRREMV